MGYAQLLPKVDPDTERAVLREILEQDFLLFVEYFFKQNEGTKFFVNEHHVKIIDALMRCHRHECNRLVINIPPRYGKTEVVVIMFIAWCLAKNPRCKFIHLSFNEPLVLDNSARIRELIQSDAFQELWPIAIKSDAKAKNLWRTQQGGGLKANSTKGPVTGFGAGLGEDVEGFGGALIVDDPLKPDDAESEIEMNGTNRRFNTTVKTRLNNPKATPIIMIMQRLHDNDPSGFVLNGGTGEKWEHLKIPVLRKDGTPLWPYRHGMKELIGIQVADKHTWNGQYMQEPIPDEGDFFTLDKARWYDKRPKHLNYYGASDYAASDNRDADFTEHGIFGVCPNGNVYLVDWWSGQTKPDVWIEEQIDLIAKYHPLLWGGEGGPIKAAIESWLKKRMAERKTYAVLRWQHTNTPNYKIAIARSFQALWEAGRVYLPEGKEWAQDVLRQLTRFPLGTLDDKVDTCSIFAQMINKVWSQDPPKPEVDNMPKSPIVGFDLEDYAPKGKKPWQ